MRSRFDRNRKRNKAQTCCSLELEPRNVRTVKPVRRAHSAAPFQRDCFVPVMSPVYGMTQGSGQESGPAGFRKPDLPAILTSRHWGDVDMTTIRTSKGHAFGRNRPGSDGSFALHTQPERNTTFRPLPPPTGKPPYHLDLKSIIPDADYATIVAAGKLTFHLNGDMG